MLPLHLIVKMYVSFSVLNTEFVLVLLHPETSPWVSELVMERPECSILQLSFYACSFCING